MYSPRQIATDVYTTNLNSSADRHRTRAAEARVRFDRATDSRRAREQQRYEAECARLRASMRLA